MIKMKIVMLVNMERDDDFELNSKAMIEYLTDCLSDILDFEDGETFQIAIEDTKDARNS